MSCNKYELPAILKELCQSPSILLISFFLALIFLPHRQFT
jgi:hypothetical protein